MNNLEGQVVCPANGGIGEVLGTIYKRYYDGDGTTDMVVYHIPTNQWFLYGTGNLGQFGWGGMASFPIPGDYDGNGVMERAFYRPSENRWFIEGEADFYWGWEGSDFMPITSQITIYNWFRFVLRMFQ